MIKKCIGCGSELQNKDPLKVGYSPKDNAKLCQRCFKLKNYNQKEIINLKYTNDEILDLINKKAKTVFFITDFLNINKDVIDMYKKIKSNKYLVISKLDFIPFSIKKEKYIDYIKESYSVDEKVLLVSGKKKSNIKELKNLIENSKDSYLCGFTNSGKSTLINSLSEDYGRNANILTSLMPNTTLDVIKIKLDEGIYVYDTPGFITKDEFKEKAFPKSYLKPVTLQVKEREVVSINDEMYISSNSKNSFTFYISNDIKVTKIYKDIPRLSNNIILEENSDIVIKNLGFINIKKECTISVSDNLKTCEIRKSMF